MANISMYICSDCGCAFDKPWTRCEQEVHTELDDRPVEYLYYDICPECQGEDFEEADYCEYCGDVVRKTELIGSCVCKACMEQIITSRDDIVSAYIKEDMAAFGEWLHEHMEMF